jgi:DNA-binding transcriptional regulator/RsmH inhibitor MraZ
MIRPPPAAGATLFCGLDLTWPASHLRFRIPLPRSPHYSHCTQNTGRSLPGQNKVTSLESLHDNAVGLKVPDQVIDPFNIHDELSEIGQNDALFEVWDNLRMANCIASMPIEVEGTIKKLSKVLREDLVGRLAFAAVV